MMGEQDTPSDTIPSSGRWVIPIYIFTAIGIPAGIAVYLRDKVLGNPFLAIVILVVYVLFAALGGFVLEVWGRLQKRLADPVTDWLYAKLEDFFSPYYKHYRQHIIYEHRFFDVKGLSTQGIYTLELEQVFVELSMVPQAPGEVTNNPFPLLPHPLSEGRHAIWDYLASKTLARQHLAILGAPGSGKTTLLKHLALSLVAGTGYKQLTDVSYKLPILLLLREHAQAIKDNPKLTLAQAVRDHLEKDGEQVPPGWLERRLAKGRCLVMLDGLDEVADPEQRKQVIAWVERQMHTNSKSRFIVTSRPFGYRSNPLVGAMVLEVRPFVLQQVERFVHNWYIANEIMSSQKDDPGVRRDAKKGAEELLQRLRNKATLLELAINPLLLTMIATVHRYRGRLPGQRVELYSEIFEVFLGKRQQARNIPLDLNPLQRQRVLQPLAYQMMCKEHREITLAEALSLLKEPLERVSPQTSGEDFLKLIEQSSGLLLERGDGQYYFAHLTFQEYLAAMYIKEERLEQELTKRVNDTWWHETTRLYSAQSDATPIVVACLAETPPPLAALTLAIECDEEAREIQPEVRVRLKTLLEEGIEDDDSRIRAVIADSLLKRRLKGLLSLSDDTYVDVSMITCAEYQLFLDEQRVQGKFYRPDHWLSERFAPGEGKSPVLGVRPTDARAFCNWLSERDPGDWLYRLPKAHELVGDVQKNFMAAPGYWADASDSGLPKYIGDPPAVLPPDMHQSRLNDDIAHFSSSDQREARILKIARTRSFGSTLEIARLRTSMHASTSVRTFELGTALSLARTRSLNLARTLNLQQTRDLARVLDLIRDFATDFSRTLRLLEERLPEAGLLEPPDKTIRQTKTIHHTRQSIRLQALIAADVLLEILQMDPGPQRSSGRISKRKRMGKGSDEIEIQRAIDGCLEIWISLTVLEERIQGNLQPLEGILIVKEHKHKSG